LQPAAALALKNIAIPQGGTPTVRIHSPKIERINGWTRILAVVELERLSQRLPETLWYEVPEADQDLVTLQLDSFVVALLPLAMTLKEDIEVCGPLSPRLAYGLQEYQQVLHCWLPKQFRLVKVSCNGYHQVQNSTPKKAVASAFSGGVDSYYTLWSHLPNRERYPGYAISHTLFVHGFDIPLGDTHTYESAQKAYQDLMQALGLYLLTVRTNVRDFVETEQLSWSFSHGAALASVALLFENLLARFYIPSSATYLDTEPWGSDPRLDHWLSTETLEIIHDAGSISRVDKIAAIADWPETFTRLRVCWERLNGLTNCCKCNKCISTMIALELTGNLNQYATFPEPLTYEKIRGTRFPSDEFLATQTLIEKSTNLGKNEIAQATKYALFQSRNLNFINSLKEDIKQKTVFYKQQCKKFVKRLIR
jgi:hypothetical protein